MSYHDEADRLAWERKLRELREMHGEPSAIGGFVLCAIGGFILGSCLALLV